MKKVLLMGAIGAVVAACTPLPEQTSSVPMDMKTVAEYNQRVASGNTVNPNQKDSWELNASDRQAQKVIIYAPRIYPRVGYGMYY